jgi:outer membrane protein OmpA-like peptidoglycan-associated protein
VTQSTNSDAKTRPQKSKNQQNWLLVLIFRLLLMGVGGGLALISGIVFAYFSPNPNPQKPLLLKIWERLDGKQPIAPANASLITPDNNSNSQPLLTPAQKQEAQAKLTKLQGQMKQLSQEIATLETQLGGNVSNLGLEARLQAIAQQIEVTSSNNAKPVEKTHATQSPTASGKLKVTLPSDLLFEENNTLRQDSRLILDKIIADLRDLPASTIRITAHTDDKGDNQDNRELSFQRAKAVEQYLAEALGDKYKWLTIGEGATHPLVPNDSPINQQRNRRLEIALE